MESHYDMPHLTNIVEITSREPDEELHHFPSATAQPAAHFGETVVDLVAPISSERNNSSMTQSTNRHPSQSSSFAQAGSRHAQLTSPDLFAHGVPDLNANMEALDGSDSYPDPALDFCSIPTDIGWHDRSKEFPRFGPSACYSDAFIVSALEEARSEHQQGRFNTTERVTLKKILATPPLDCLSFRLFHYICGYGPMPLHNLLAIFWVQYLFLRVRPQKRAMSILLLATSDGC